VDKKAIVGDATIHERFLDSHVPFLQEFPALRSLTGKMWDAALDRYNEPLDHALVGEELEKATVLRLAQIIVFYLARASFDCFDDIFLLAGNGRGFAAKMMLRPMYEHLVTARFIAIKPDEAKHFNDHASVEKWKMWIRTLEAVPQAGGAVPAEVVEELKKKQQEVRDQLKSEICKKCGTPKTQEAWTRVALDNMAEEVDKVTGTSLSKLYAPCYLTPTAFMHPTALGLEYRLTRVPGVQTYDEMPDELAHDSLFRGHEMALRVLKHVNSYFDLGFDAEVQLRYAAFPKIWGGAQADPPSES
jgi:Family of unknown function (DUF5677)